MLDKSIPFSYVIMIKNDTNIYPNYNLPTGYKFKMYSSGDELKWAEIELSVGQFESLEEGIRMFDIEFNTGKLKKEERIIYVIDPNGEYVATGALWDGPFNGCNQQKMHWIAVKEEYKGKGIAKALVTKILDLYNELGYSGFIYLLSESWCYSALNIYKKFGFVPYVDGNPLDILPYSNEEFNRSTEEGWNNINNKIKSYKK